MSQPDSRILQDFTFVRISLLQSFCRYLLEVAAVLRDQYGGDIPDSVEGLCKLKGVREAL